MAAILAVHWIVGFTSLLNKSPAYDEPAHLTGGYSYWRFNDYRLHPENGNLPQRFAALPLAVRSDIEFPSRDQATWRKSDIWAFSQQFLFESGNDLETLMRWGHGFAALFGVGICLLVYLWSRSLFGEWGGLVSLLLCAMSPSMLAHGPLLTSDACTTLFFTASVWSIWRVLEAVTWPRVALGSALAAALFLSKASAVLILPMAVVIALLHFLLRHRLVVDLPGRSWEVQTPGRYFLVILGIVAVYAIVIWIAIWTAFGWRYSAVPAAEQSEHAFHKFKTLDASCENLGSMGTVIRGLAEWRALPEAWLYGTSYVLNHRNRRAYFNGEYSLHGWRSYFPYCVLVKTELTLFAVLLASACAGLVKWRQQRAAKRVRERPDYAAVPLWVLLLVYSLVALSTTLAIGHRHMLPIYPTMYILAGGAAFWFDRRYRIPAALVGLLLAASVVETARCYPHYLAYFNQLVDRRAAYRHLVDSSLDWGQDLPLLKQWLDQHAATDGQQLPVYLGYFGKGDPTYYSIHAARLSDEGDQKDELPLRGGVYCLSATFLQAVYGPVPGPWNQEFEEIYRKAGQKMQTYRALGPDKLAALRDEKDQGYLGAVGAYETLRVSRLRSYLRSREPDDQVGYSILIYRLSDDDLAQALAGPPKEFDREATFARQIANQPGNTDTD